MHFHFHPDKNPDGGHILFLGEKSKWGRIQQAYFILGDKNEDRHHSKHNAYDKNCDEDRKLWREQSGFD